MRYLLTIALLTITLSAITSPAHAGEAGCAEDQACWTWPSNGNGMRGVVTSHGTPKVVTCGDFRWLVRHGDLDPNTPWLKGDYTCGRRHRR